MIPAKFFCWFAVSSSPLRPRPFSLYTQFYWQFLFLARKKWKKLLSDLVNFCKNKEEEIIGQTKTKKTTSLIAKTRRIVKLFTHFGVQERQTDGLCKYSVISIFIGNAPGGFKIEHTKLKCSTSKVHTHTNIQKHIHKHEHLLKHAYFFVPTQSCCSWNLKF